MEIETEKSDGNHDLKKVLKVRFRKAMVEPTGEKAREVKRLLK